MQDTAAQSTTEPGEYVKPTPHLNATARGTVASPARVRRVYIFVCGILTLPGDARNWTGRAVTWTHLHTNDRAEKVEYFTGPLGRPFHQRARAARLAKMLRYYAEADWDVVLVGHSNGCDVICDVLKEWPERTPRVSGVHLIAAACSDDFNLCGNGLNLASINRVIGEVTVYIGSRDWALELAGSTLGWLLGYGKLGRSGPRNELMPVEIVRRDFGHGDWFAAEHFDETMRTISNRADRADAANGCERPPNGWMCSRAAGHEGPCAARRDGAMSCWEMLAGISLGGIALGVAMMIFGCAAGQRVPRLPKLPAGSYAEVTGFSKDLNGTQATGMRGTIHIPLGRNNRTDGTERAYLASGPAFRANAFLRE